MKRERKQDLVMGKKTHGQRSRPKHWPRQVGGGLRSYDGEVREERKYPPGCLGKEPERHRGTRGIGRTRLKAEDSTSLMSGECNHLSSVSSQQRFEATDIKVLGASQLSDSPCYGSWTDQFYLENKGKYILKVWGHADPKDVKRREREREKESEHAGEAPALWLLFSYIFFLSLGLAYADWVSQECCLFYLRSSLWSLDLPLFYFCGLFPCLLATAILDSFFLF